MGQPQPALIILGAPGLWKSAPRRYPCEVCGEAYPIQTDTFNTVKDLRKKKDQLVLVICYGCFDENRALFEHPGSTRTGTQTARRMYGLDES